MIFNKTLSFILVYAFVDVHEILENLESILKKSKIIDNQERNSIQTKSAEISLLNAFRILCRVMSPTLIFGNLNIQKSVSFFILYIHIY